VSALGKSTPKAGAAYLAEGNATQARKRVSADAIVRDERGQVLVVRPTYKPGWDMPGGMAEANERPDIAARRELREELGLDLIVGRLARPLAIPHPRPGGPQPARCLEHRVVRALCYLVIGMSLAYARLTTKDG
jgi:ADP-ribose pyrophosphatase YjhB (NUDIX family)